MPSQESLFRHLVVAVEAIAGALKDKPVALSAYEPTAYEGRR